MAKTRKDNTGKERQARRREREKQWLRENGWQSWEALHTALMNGTAEISLNAAPDQATLGGVQK